MPIPTVQPWSPAANYASGPDVGTATKTAPAYTNFIPAVPIAAQEMNYLLNQRDVRFQAAHDETSALLMQTWRTPVTAVSMAGAGRAFSTPPVWNRTNNIWVVFPSDGTNAGPMKQSLDGQDWSTYSDAVALQANTIPIAAGVASDGSMVIMMTGAGTTVSIHLTPSGTRDSTDAQGAWAGFALTCGVQFYVSKWQFIGGVQSGGTFTGKSAHSSTGTGLFTDDHTSLPSAWQTSTNHIFGMLVALNESAPGAGDATDALVVQQAATAGVDFNRMMKYSTLTDVTPAGLTAQGGIITGAIWSNYLQQWVVSIANNSDTFIYTSPDMVTWTLSQTYPILAGAVGVGLAEVGSTWVMDWGTRLHLSKGYGPAFALVPVVNQPILTFVSSGSGMIRQIPGEVANTQQVAP
jgi:hypothetical protein